MHALTTLGCAEAAGVRAGTARDKRITPVLIMQRLPSVALTAGTMVRGISFLDLILVMAPPSTIRAPGTPNPAARMAPMRRSGLLVKDRTLSLRGQTDDHQAKTNAAERVARGVIPGSRDMAHGRLVLVASLSLVAAVSAAGRTASYPCNAARRRRAADNRLSGIAFEPQSNRADGPLIPHVRTTDFDRKWKGDHQCREAAEKDQFRSSPSHRKPLLFLRCATNAAPYPRIAGRRCLMD